ATKEEKSILANEIANLVAETIVSYMHENKNRILPELYFNTTNYETMSTFDRAFDRWAGYDKSYFLWKKQISELGNSLISECLTKDESYSNALKDLSAYINEKNSILILGETGVGKSYMAKVLHNLSNRPMNKFVAINCAELGRNSLNIQLFGSKKGSYTDSREDIIGAVELAEGGTLFLDEIGCTDKDIQAKLLKFIGEGTYRMFGDNKERSANVRLMFGTNVDLEKLSQDGEFRHDLYERIAQITIEIPPLRKRKDDIPLYVDYFLDELNKDSDVIVQFSDEAKSELMNFLWPGNVRQLESYISKLHIAKKQSDRTLIDKEDLQSNPPRNYFYKQNRSFQELEDNLMHFLSDWNPEDGKFIDDFLQPIVAKLYIEDVNGIKKQSGKITGMDGTGGNDGMLNKQFRRYALIKEKHNK
ncbi:MAG: sigma-54-dependent transcriptional regulator, partial [Methanococcaceae archaeon]